MLRRRLMFFLGSVLTLLLIVSVLSIALLQNVLSEMDHATNQDGAILANANDMTETITAIEIELREVQLGHTHHLDTLLDRINALKEEADLFGRQYSKPIPEAHDAYEAELNAFSIFQQHVATLATVENESLARAHTAEAIGASISLRQQIITIATLMRQHTTNEEHAAVIHFRWIVLSIAIGFLIVINVSFIVLYRMTVMVTAPVEQLVDANRRLAREEFTYRLPVQSHPSGVGGGGDEFNELAAAFNQLAERLQANEQRKLETLAQTAVMLNHELNNASAIIKLQLQLLRRQTGGGGENPAFERALQQISESLERMTRTVESLKRIRRIVLTDYTADTKMLDLEKSTTEN
ncbi:MAG TPA: HAMP domain-containing protein [Phycisphaerae bacterium]|nr:HAMP domain-containing protein [Phycisphaerae bacterium]